MLANLSLKLWIFLVVLTVTTTASALQSITYTWIRSTDPATENACAPGLLCAEFSDSGANYTKQCCIWPGDLGTSYGGACVAPLSVDERHLPME